MKKYTRQEKIAYYAQKIELLKAQLTITKNRLEKTQQRLEYIQSDEYQDWNSDLQKDLNNKKAPKRGQ